MTLGYGLLLGVLGILITITGLMIALIVYNKSIEKQKTKTEIPNALKDLLTRK